MKNIVRPDAPKSLRDNAVNWTDELILAVNKFKQDGTRVPERIQNRYKQKDVLQALKQMYSDSNGRCYCCYCETVINVVDFPHIEHRKPKSLFPELTFDWDNLHLACEKCNNHKSDKWDNDDQILDAVCDVPITSHLDYHLEPIKGVYRRTISKRGITTVEHAQLDRDELLLERLEVLHITFNYLKEIFASGQAPSTYTLKKALTAKYSGKYGSMIKWTVDIFFPHIAGAN